MPFKLQNSPKPICHQNINDLNMNMTELVLIMIIFVLYKVQIVLFQSRLLAKIKKKKCDLYLLFSPLLGITMFVVKFIYVHI